MKKIFIDGKEGTTGLRIFDRLSLRDDVTLITLPEEKRKDLDARREALNRCDIAFLCLPDAAAMEAVSLIENEQVCVIDTSTAHRTSPDWVYGMAELSGGEERIASSKRIAVPGCHASGFIALVTPLVQAGLLPSDVSLTCHSITGYSGGGKKMIAAYGDADRDLLLSAPRQYGLTQQHKHLREMQAIPGLTRAPIFCPIVADFYSGMAVTVPLFADMLCGGATVEDIRHLYEACYRGPIVTYRPEVGEDGFFSALGLSGRDDMEISVAGNDERILLTARYDNLGKGASGAAIQCMNLVLGCESTRGLCLTEGATPLHR